MPRVLHFEIGADDPKRAVRFYQEALDWRMSEWPGQEEYYLVTTGDDSEPGINGAIMRRGLPGGVINTVGVASLDEAVAKVVKAGGKVIEARITVPTIGYLAYVTDTEGNVFGMMQADPSAK